MNKREGPPEIKPNPDTGETPEELRRRVAKAQERAGERARSRREPGGGANKEVDLTEGLKEEILEAYKKQEGGGQ